MRDEYKVGYECSFIGCQCTMTMYIDGSHKCIAHAPLHCDHCRSLNVGLLREDRTRGIRRYNCYDCRKVSTKPI